jgi:hypothetical protein
MLDSVQYMQPVFSGCNKLQAKAGQNPAAAHQQGNTTQAQYACAYCCSWQGFMPEDAAVVFAYYSKTFVYYAPLC